VLKRTNVLPKLLVSLVSDILATTEQWDYSIRGNSINYGGAPQNPFSITHSYTKTPFNVNITSGGVASSRVDSTSACFGASVGGQKYQLRGVTICVCLIRPNNVKLCVWLQRIWRSWIRASWYNYENNQQDALYRLIYYSKTALRVSAFSPIIRSTRLYLQYLVVFTEVAAGSNLGE